MKLLVADVIGPEVTAHAETSEQTRLGSGFYPSRQLQPAAIQRTVQAIVRFAAEARHQGASAVRVIATSAARDAVNQTELVDAVEAASGLRVEIISGEQEAAWAFQGVASDPTLTGQPLLIVDAGGGSAEFILGDGPCMLFCRSYPLGTVRLLERLQVSDPPAPSDWSRCRTMIDEVLDAGLAPAIHPHWEQLAGRAVQAVGTSGTATILAKIRQGHDGYDRRLLDGVRVSASWVQDLRDRLWHMALSRRTEIPGLPAERADVMLTGVGIYEAVLGKLHCPDLCVSLRGLRFAALMDLAAV